MTALLHSRDILFRVDMDLALLSRTAAELLDKMGRRVHALRMFSGQAAVLHTDLAELTLTVQHSDAPRTRLTIQPIEQDGNNNECAKLTEVLTRQLCDALAGKEVGEHLNNAELSPTLPEVTKSATSKELPSEDRPTHIEAPDRGAPMAPRDIWQVIAISSFVMMMAIATLSSYGGTYGF